MQCFTTELQGLLEYIAPLGKIRVKQNVGPWAADADVVAARCQRDKLYRRAVATGDSVIWQQYRSSRNKVNKLLRNANCSYLSKLASSKQEQSAKFWKYFRHLSHCGAKTSLSLEDLDFTSDDLNNYFLSVADKTVQGISFTNISQLSFITVNAAMFHLSTVSDDTVISAISSLDTNKAAGVDGIPARFIKAHSASIGGLIACLVNHCIASDIFPDLWKHAVVTPVQKSKENMEITNFCPISVLPVLSKVLKRIVHDPLLSNLLSFDLLSDRQSGFHPQYSTQDVLLRIRY